MRITALREFTIFRSVEMLNSPKEPEKYYFRIIIISFALRKSDFKNTFFSIPLISQGPVLWFLWFGNFISKFDFSEVFISEPSFLRCSCHDFRGNRLRLHNRFYFFVVLKFIRPLWRAAFFFWIIFGVHLILHFDQISTFGPSDKVLMHSIEMTACRLAAASPLVVRNS